MNDCFIILSGLQPLKNLEHFIRSCDDLAVGLEASLCGDHISKFLGEIDITALKNTGGNIASDLGYIIVLRLT